MRDKKINITRFVSKEESGASTHAKKSAHTPATEKKHHEHMSRKILSIIGQQRVEVAPQKNKKIHAKYLHRHADPALLDIITSHHESPNDSSQSEQQVGEAVLFAKSITDPEERDKILYELTIDLVMRGDLKKARQLLDLIKNAQTRENTLFDIIQILTDMGEFQCAKEMDMNLKDPKVKEKAALHIVQKYLEIKEWEDAIEFINRIREKNSQLKAKQLVLQFAKTSGNEELAKQFENI